MPGLLLALLALALSSPTGAETSSEGLTRRKYNNIVIFGDSVSDNGNIYQRTNFTYPPSPPNFKGRFTNGLVWIEVAAAKGHATLWNYAEGGATACTGTQVEESQADPIKGVPVPYSVPQQVAAYLASTPRAVIQSPKRVHVIEAGANDIGVALGRVATHKLNASDPAAVQAFITSTVACIMSSTDALLKAGAHKVVVLTVLDLGITPSVRAAGPQASAFASQLAAAMSDELVSQAKTRGVRVVVYDGRARLLAAYHQPSLVDRFINDTSTPCCSDPAHAGRCTGAPGTVCPPNVAVTRLFWDVIHPQAPFYVWFGLDAYPTLMS